MITDKMIEAQRLLFSKPVLIGEKIAVRLLTVRNKHFGILNGVTAPGRIMVDIDPCFVFGNGIHATTRMATEAIEKHLKPGVSVLDVGCGTGIQSIISILLGAEHVDSVDINHKAIMATEHNAKLNGVSERLTAMVSNLTENVRGNYDLIVANVLADPIKDLLVGLKNFTHADTTVVLSGIKDTREDDVIDVAMKNFSVVERTVRDNWVCLVLKPL